MFNVKKLFNSLIISFIVLGFLSIVFFPINRNLSMNAEAEAPTYQEITNSYPNYLNIDKTSPSGYVDDIIFLMQGGSSGSQVNISIASNGKITNTNPTNEEGLAEKNYAYIPSPTNDENNPQEYYYFRFSNSMSLYYNLTNSQIQSGLTGTNLMEGQSITNYVSENNDDGETAFTISGYGVTPQKLEVNFALDNNIENDASFTENNIVLKQEGIYTLVINVNYYYTNNGGITFTPATETIYYTFMVFNSDTYFNSTTGLPNITPSANIQQSSLTSSDTFSRYYFYNYSFAGDSSTPVNALPDFTYNPDLYQITISYTDINQNSYQSSIIYSNNQFSQIDENGNIIDEENYFVYPYMIDGEGKLVFLDIGYYDLSFQYLYKSISNGQEIIYELPLSERLDSSILQNKNQRLFIYGYQAVYSDQSNINTQTNQPETVELKTFNFDNLVYENNADLTSQINNFISNNSASYANLADYVDDENPTSPYAFSSEELKNATLDYLNTSNPNELIQPVSTNQTPIKFLTNSKNILEQSYIYTLSTNSKTEGDGQVTTYYEITSTNNFEGFNQNNPGTYLYIIQYTFDNYLSESGTLQSSYYHYQIFFFEVTNSIPSVTILDSDFNEIYASGFTNQSVYLLNDSQNNVYDAEVTITLSAFNYNTGYYFFENQNITDLESFGIYYKQFEQAGSESENYLKYNENVAGKYGILIENTNIYANAKFTVKITSANSDIPSIRTFTIDTNEISGISARNVSVSTSTTYKLGNNLSSYNTNQPVVFSWNEKASGASTYGFVKYIPIVAINYYSSQTSSATISQLLDYWVQQGVIPVSYKFNISGASSWTEYKNSLAFTSTIDATYVKSSAGFYILEVYDQAGNSSFEIYLIDDTSPLFLLRTSFNDENRQIMSNNQSIAVPESGTRMWIEWADNKAIYLDYDLSNYLNISPYAYTLNYSEANSNLSNILNQFFNINNSDLLRVSNISIPTINSSTDEEQIITGISTYNGNYLVVDIDDVSYIKDTSSNNYSRYQGINNYEIIFIDENDQAIEGTYKILIRDSSNTYSSGNEEYDFLNNPSAHLTFNVTSDDSKLAVYRGNNGEQLAWASYSLSGTLNYYESDGEQIYTHLTSMDGVELIQSDLTYRFAYYTPINADENIYISFIPLANNGSTLQSVRLTYYPYTKTYTVIDGIYYWYYDLDYENKQVIDLYNYNNNVSYDAGEVVTQDILLGSGSTLLAGRYVIERQYLDDNDINRYDYFKRTITFDVDNYELISPLESVNNGVDSSLESIVGGDIILSMYSGEGNSNIQVSFPSYNSSTGLNSNSFYTQESFTNEDTIPTFAVQGNKLPMSLYIPKYKYTINSYYNETSNSYEVNYNNNLSFYGNTYYELGSDNLWHVYSEGIEIVEPFTNEIDAYNYVYSNTSITEYEISVKVQANVTQNGVSVTKYYYSNGSDTDGYLNLYETSSNGVIPDDASPAEPFYLQGSYIVTIYQSSNDPQSSFYSFYKFGFEITSQEPQFSIINADGYELNETSVNTYYSNSDTITIQWEVPTSQYEAKINESFDYITINSSQAVTHSEIFANGNTRYFTIDCSNLITSTNSYLSITMEYEGHNDSYYKRTTKTIYFDRSAPMANLQYLMTNTENATNLFTKNYQEINMRTYQDYNGNEVVISASNYDQINNMSYSFSTSTGYFKYFSYNVNTDFFNNILVNTLQNASNYRYDTQYIYYEEIPSIDSYTQVDKNSFSQSNYYELTTSGADDLKCGYYEIVEMDYAGNMTVYVVYLIDSSFSDDENVSNNALVFTNALHSEPQVVTNDQIIDGFNIYSRSGFELQELNYMSDPWSMVYIQLSGQSSVRYMASPWLEDGYVYKITINSSGIAFEQIALTSIFDNVESSSNKHTIVFTDRINGLSYNTYLSIMDASISTQKVEDPNHTSAILNISVPTLEQYQSTTTSFVFPTKISIYQYNPNSVEGDGYELIMVANQNPYGTWLPDEEFENALSYISFTTINNGSTLQILINLGANSAQKIRYEIIDNFGITTTIIQLANEVSYDEISGVSKIYEITESNSDITYISDNTIRFSYNALLYSIDIFDYDNNNITSNNTAISLGNNIYAYDFSPTQTNIWNDYYKIIVTDSENGEVIKTLHIRIYNQLPYLVFQTNAVNSGGIVFIDRYLEPLTQLDFSQTANYTINFNGINYTTTAYSATTYSSSITVRFRNGQDLNYVGNYAYQDTYGYSVYLSSNNGLTWQNINSVSSNTSGHTISGAGDYIIFIKYDSDEILTNQCRIFNISILDSSTSYYYITVDGTPVQQGDMKYTDNYGYEYDVNYIVSVDYADKNNRLQIVANEELGVEIDTPRVETTGTNVYVEIYHYECAESRGDFTIIYINQTNNIITQFTYETPTGSTESIRSTSSVVIVANNETESSFDKLKLNFNSYYGIEQNKINIEILKYFNGSYVEITPLVYNSDNNMSYIYLEKSGSYRVQLYDSCSPANIHLFGTSNYIDIVFLNSVPFIVSYTDTTTGETVVSERVDSAVYNGDVTLSLYNLSSYYQASGYPSISVKLNGANYSGFTTNNYSYTFSRPGYYSVIFTATSNTGITIRQDEYNFTIINENESRYAYEFVQFKNYYIESVIKDGIDITQDLIDIGNYDTIKIDGKTYLSSLMINYLDEKTGVGKYQITINTNDKTYENTSSSKYTFEFWLNMQTPPINISLKEGESTTGDITISFNVQNFYNAMGDCYLKIGSEYHYFTADRLADYGETYTITINSTGTYFIQVYTMSNNLLYSYKVIRSEPLNTFAIIAIIIGVIAAAAIITITILLRRRQRVK